MNDYDIDPGVPEAIARFKLPESLGFGLVDAPVMFEAEWREGRWGRGRLAALWPDRAVAGSARATVRRTRLRGHESLSRGTEPARIFFAPTRTAVVCNAPRSRLSMPVVPEALFFQGISAVAHACSAIMPTQSGRSLYLRPFLFGTESGYMLRNSRTFRFMVIGNPVESYASGPMQVVIERAEVRAAVGGIGEAKAAANYAASLRASNAAVERGRTVALWLDGNEHRYLQELSGMNIFAVLDGELHTPELDGAILPGITRDSLLTLAKSLGYKVHERQISLDEVLEGIEQRSMRRDVRLRHGRHRRPIAVLAESDGREYKLRQTDVVAKRLREALLAIQERRAPDPFGWTRELAPG